MRENRKSKRFIDGEGNIWTEDGLIIEDENEPGSMMDFINRTSNGEDPEKAAKECELARKRKQEKIELAKKSGKRVEL